MIDDISYTCGATLQELDLPDKFSCVYVREHNYFDTIEKLYYSAGFEPICIYCAAEDVEDCNEFILNVLLALTDHWLKRDFKICLFLYIA